MADKKVKHLNKNIIIIVICTSLALLIAILMWAWKGEDGAGTGESGHGKDSEWTGTPGQGGEPDQDGKPALAGKSVLRVMPKSWAWSTKLSVPDYDPLWNIIKKNIKSHRDMKSIDIVLNTANKLNKKYPGRAEPLLWLAWSYSQKSLWCECGREEETKLKKTSIGYATQAYSINKDPALFRIFLNSASAFKNIDELKRKHGKWLRDSVPLPYGREIPELKKYPEWKQAVRLWDSRLDIKKAKSAVEIFKKIAEKYPDDINAILWASRSIYYIGSYHSTAGRKETAAGFFKEAMSYTKKALKLDPYNIIANYWYAVNLGRSHENESVFSQSLIAKEMLEHITYCFRENMLYYYGGPIIITGGAYSRSGYLTRQVLDVLGVKLDDIMTVMYLAEVCYPEYLRITNGIAEIYFNIGEKEKARKILKDLVKRNPDKNRLHAAENHLTLMEARAMLDKIENN